MLDHDPKAEKLHLLFYPGCHHDPETAPCASAVECLHRLPPCLKDSSESQQVELRRARVLGEWARNDISRMVIYVGAGTCGLGAGAQASLDRARAWLENHQVDAEIVRVGCIGLCSEEPILDVQLPGRARLSFGRVDAESVDDILDAMIRLGDPLSPLVGDHLLGQHVDGALAPFDGVPGRP